MITTYHSPFLPILSGTIHINGHKDIEPYGCLSLVKSLMLSGFYPSPLAFGAVLHTQINWLEWHKYCQSLTSFTSWFWSSMPWSVSKIARICFGGTPSSQKSCRKMIDFSSYEYLLIQFKSFFRSNLYVQGIKVDELINLLLKEMPRNETFKPEPPKKPMCAFFLYRKAVYPALK